MALVPFQNKAAKRAEDEPDWDDHDPGADTGGKMSFLDHLDELRRRIIYSVCGVGVGLIAAFFFIGRIFDFIFIPMQRPLAAGQTLIYTDATEPFMLQIKIALMAGLLLASPIVFSQVWLFIAPGLYSNEKKLAIPFIVMSTFFFVAGAAFSHYMVFPIVWNFFVGFQTPYLKFLPTVGNGFSLYLRLMLGLGLTFELPTLVLFLAKMGLITPRFMIRNFAYAIMIIAVLAAVLSPDGGGVGMLAMGGPVLILYVFSIGLAWLFGKKKKKHDDDEDAPA